MNPTDAYLEKAGEILARVAAQKKAIEQAAEIFFNSISQGGMVHLFGSGHSRILVEEMWPRYGSFPGFNPIVELSLTFHNLVVGANGQRQAMFLENSSGLAERILRNYNLSARDSALVASSSGCNLVPIEMGQGFKKANLPLVAIVSKRHAEASQSRHPQGIKLQDIADIVLDTGAPVGDAMVKIPGLETAVAPGSTVGGCLLINCLKAEVALRLVRAGLAPKVLTAGALIGQQKANEIFEAAYDEHSTRMAQLYSRVATTTSKPSS